MAIVSVCGETADRGISGYTGKMCGRGGFGLRHGSHEFFFVFVFCSGKKTRTSRTSLTVFNSSLPLSPHLPSAMLRSSTDRHRDLRREARERAAVHDRQEDPGDDWREEHQAQARG